jgi:AraC-like DNA-binding protein
MQPSLLASFKFNSADYDPATGFSVWSQFMTGFDVSDPTPDKPFSAAAEAWLLGPLVVTRTQLSAAQLVRSPTQIRNDQIDHYAVVLQLQGDWHAAIPGREIRSAPGITCIFDKSQPFTTLCASPVDVIIMLVPRAVLNPALAVMNLHGHPLHNAAGRLLSDYLHLLVGRLPSLTEIEAPYVAKATADILVSCVLATGAQTGQAPPVDIVRRAARLIDRAPAEPFTPEKLQSTLNLSRSSLYRAFEPLGGVAGFIRQRRLARIHAMICAGDNRSVTQFAAAFGFSSATQLTRAFRAHFGYSASELRSRTRLPDHGPRLPVTELFETWTKALS